MLDTLSSKFRGAFKHLQGKSKISENNIEETLKEVRLALLEADVNFKVAKSFVSSVQEKALGQKVLEGVEPGEQFVKIMHDELTALMGEKSRELDTDREGLTVVLMVGLNGVGKTTFSGKIANLLQNKKKKNVLLVPADNFRPAAKDQLNTLSKSINVDIFDSDLSQGPEKIAKAGIEAAKEAGKDFVIIDTAGRLHVDDNLMDEIKLVKKATEGNFTEIFLVADAMSGQEAVTVAKSFHDALGLTGVTLSKMDSDAKGGAALSIKQMTGLSISYLSVGEKMGDLETFHPDRMAKRLLDMGDVVSLVEKAEEVVNEKDAENMMKNLEKNRLTIEDFLKQLDSLNKLGSMKSLMKMIPGMGGMLDQVGDLGPAEEEMKKMKVMANSMTKKERRDYRIIDESRKERIAKGSGHQVSDVSAFLKKFKEMEKMMTGMFQMFKGGGMPGMPGMPGGGGQKGFRSAPMQGMGKKKKKKGKGRGPFGGGFFK